MKKSTLLLLLFTLCHILSGQQKESVDILVEEGVHLHDIGDYAGAIKKYDEALLLDKYNLFALAEKAMTLMFIDRSDEAVKLCELAIEKHRGSDLLYMVYVICGNGYDNLENGSRSIEVYDEGLKQFPDFYQLHFNKGVTLLGMDKIDEALLCFRQSALLNPNHTGSHNAIGRTFYVANEYLHSLLAFARFFVLEPEGGRAQENISYVQGILSENAAMKELGLDITLDNQEQYRDETEVVRFIRQFEAICSAINEQKESSSDFFRNYYAPFFLEMQNRGMINTLGYIVFASSGNPDIMSWIRSNEENIVSFYEWAQSYKWISVF